MEVVLNTALKFRVPVKTAQDICTQVQKSDLVHTNGDESEVVCYWGYEETKHITEMLDEVSGTTAKLPSPMLRDYNWPGIYKPFDHQRDTASFLSLRHRAFCFNEAGTGKTSAAIWAADYLMGLGLVKRVLIICPLSIMNSAWQADIFKTAMHRTCGVAHGTAEKRKKVLNEGYDFTVINYDGIPTVFDQLYERFDLIIVDEANAYKTATTKRWKMLAKLVTPQVRLWMMTGTPASQSPVDAFGLARLVSPSRVPKFYTSWRDKVMYQVTRFKWMPKHDAKQQVFNALQPAIRYTKQECLDLPKITYQTRIVPLTPTTMSFYKELKKQMLIEAAGEQVSAVNAAVSIQKLLQISGGAVYTDKQQVVQFDVSPRLNALKEVLDETTNKVVVFVPFLHTIDLVTEYLTHEGVTNAVIKGDVSLKDRSNAIDQFQRLADPRVLVIQPQSAAHGITLTAADTVVFWSPVTSVEMYLQCIGRIERVGQKNAMTVVHLQGSDVERKTYAMLQNKVDAHQSIVDLYKQEMEE
jgi:SNF2 family DNA or RNA helicase